MRLEYIDATNGETKVDGLVLDGPETRGEVPAEAAGAIVDVDEDKDEVAMDWKSLHAATHVLRLQIGRALQSNITFHPHLIQFSYSPLFPLSQD